MPIHFDDSGLFTSTAGAVWINNPPTAYPVTACMTFRINSTDASSAARHIFTWGTKSNGDEHILGMRFSLSTANDPFTVRLKSSEGENNSCSRNMDYTPASANPFITVVIRVTATAIDMWTKKWTVDATPVQATQVTPHNITTFPASGLATKRFETALTKSSSGGHWGGDFGDVAIWDVACDDTACYNLCNGASPSAGGSIPTPWTHLRGKSTLLDMSGNDRHWTCYSSDGLLSWVTVAGYPIDAPAGGDDDSGIPEGGGGDPPDAATVSAPIPLMVTHPINHVPLWSFFVRDEETGGLVTDLIYSDFAGHITREGHAPQSVVMEALAVGGTHANPSNAHGIRILHRGNGYYDVAGHTSYFDGTYPAVNLRLTSAGAVPLEVRFQMVSRIFSPVSQELTAVPSATADLGTKLQLMWQRGMLETDYEVIEGLTYEVIKNAAGTKLAKCLIQKDPVAGVPLRVGKYQAY